MLEKKLLMYISKHFTLQPHTDDHPRSVQLRDYKAGNDWYLPRFEYSITRLFNLHF